MLKDTMIERIAKILCKQHDGNWQADRNFHCACAAQIVTAMREPTEKMIDTGWMMSGVNSPLAIWHAMIDEILK